MSAITSFIFNRFIDMSARRTFKVRQANERVSERARQVLPQLARLTSFFLAARTELAVRSSSSSSRTF